MLAASLRIWLTFRAEVGTLLAVDGVEQGPGPGGPLGQQLDGPGPELGLQPRVARQDDLGDLRDVEPARATRASRPGTRGEPPPVVDQGRPDDVEDRRRRRDADQGLEGLDPPARGCPGEVEDRARRPGSRPGRSRTRRPGRRRGTAGRRGRRRGSAPSDRDRASRRARAPGFGDRAALEPLGEDLQRPPRGRGDRRRRRRPARSLATSATAGLGLGLRAAQQPLDGPGQDRRQPGRLRRGRAGHELGRSRRPGRRAAGGGFARRSGRGSGRPRRWSMTPIRVGSGSTPSTFRRGDRHLDADVGERVVGQREDRLADRRGRPCGNCPPPGRPRPGRSGRGRRAACAWKPGSSRPVPIRVQRACIRALRGAPGRRGRASPASGRVAGSSRSRRSRWAVSR